jgi:hypothetical protein
MDIKSFIQIYDEVLPWKVLSNLIRFANISDFVEAKIGGGDENKKDFNDTILNYRHLSEIEII